MSWHRDIPPDSKNDVLDIIAKALMMRLGSSITLTHEEMRAAGELQAEIKFDDDGSLHFRAERQ